MQPTLYARRETTDDNTTINHWTPESGPLPCDVVLYHDRDCTAFFCRCPWHYSTTPDRRNKWKSINSVKWRLEWI